MYTACSQLPPQNRTTTKQPHHLGTNILGQAAGCCHRDLSQFMICPQSHYGNCGGRLSDFLAGRPVGVKNWTLSCRRERHKKLLSGFVPAWRPRRLERQILWRCGTLVMSSSASSSSSKWLPQLLASRQVALHVWKPKLSKMGLVFLNNFHLFPCKSPRL